MRVTDLPVPMQSFVTDLLNRGFDIWVIGSRVNPAKEPPNDWDILVFGTAELLDQLRNVQPIADLDVLIVVDGDHFESPWPRASDGVTKEESLVAWKWEQTGPNVSTYKGAKWPDDWGAPKRGVRVLL